MADKKAQILISAKDDSSKALNDIQKNVAGLKDAFKGLGGGIGSTLNIIKGVTGSLLALKVVGDSIQKIGDAFTFADSLNDISEQLGLTVEKLSELDYIAGQSGTSFETLQKGYTELSKNIAEANSGNKEAINSFKALGISVKDSNGNLKTTDAVFKELAESFKNSPNDAIKTATALDIMGKAGKELIPTLNQGKDGLEDLQKEAVRLGIIISSETSAQLGKLGDTFDKLEKQSKNSMAKLGASFAPALDIVLNAVLEFKAKISGGLIDQDAIEENQAKLAEFALKAVDSFDSIVNYVSGPLSEVWTFLKDIVNIAIDKVHEIIDSFTKDLADNGLKMADVIGGIAGAFKAFFEVAKGVFKGVSEVVKIFVSGIVTSFKVVGQTIGGIFASIVQGAQGNFDEAKQIIQDTFNDGVKNVNNFGDKAGQSIKSVVLEIGEGIGKGAGAFSLIGEEGVKSFNDIKNASSSLGKSLRKDFDSSKSDYENLLAQIKKTNKEAKENADRGGKGLGQKPNSSAQSEAEKEFEKFMALQKAKISSLQKSFDFENSLNDALYKANIKTVQKYFDDKETLQKEENEKLSTAYKQQVTLLEEKLKKDKNNLKLQKELEEASDKLRDTERKNTIETIKLNDEKTQSLKNYTNEVLSLQKEINKLLGVDDTIEIDIKFNDLREKFKNDPEALKQVGVLEDLEKKQDLYNKSLKNTDLINQSLSVTEKEIAQKRDSNQISLLKSFDEITKARQSQLSLLEKEYEITSKLAVSPEQQLKVRELKIAIDEAKNNLDPLAKQLDTTFQNSFGNFFDDIISGTKSVKEAFNDMVGSIVKEIFSLASKDVANTLYKSLFGDSQSLGSYFSQVLRGANIGGQLGGATGGNSSGGGISSLLGSIGSGISSLFGGIGSLFGADTGGNLQAGRPYVVGEFGKEIFIPRAGGMLLNANQTNDALSGGNRGNTIINNVQNINTPDSNSFKNSRGQIYASQQNQLIKYQKFM